MSGGHYGIDPRRKTSVHKSERPTTQMSNNPHARPYSPSTRTRPMTAMNRVSRFSALSSPRPKTNNKNNGIQGVEIKMPSNLHLQFDYIMSLTRTMPFNRAIEIGMMEIFDANICFLWLYDSHAHKFFSPTKSQICDAEQSILSYVLKEEIVLNLSRPSTNPKFDKFVDSEFMPTLYLPIVNDKSEINAILQIVRSTSHTFSTIDVSIAKQFQEKFTFYTHFLFDDDFTLFANDIARAKAKNVIPIIVEMLQKQFKCREVEFWVYDEVQKYAKYDIALNSYITVEIPGLVVRGFESGLQPVYINDCTDSKYYNKEVDGEKLENVLLVPYKLDDIPCVVCLRGKENNEKFSFIDELHLTHLTPLIVKCIIFENEDTPENSLASRLKSLLEVAEILSGVLDIDVLVPTIMERACSLLHTERCSLFLIDAKRQNLTTTFQSGLDKSISIPINHGIVGHTATTGKIVNIPDAYKDPRFNRNIDLKTGFKTKTILSVPIYNNRGEIVGVTEMINREDGKIFDDDDIKMLKAFNIFCGISLDNARLYQASLNLTKQLQSFVEMSTTLNTQSKSIRNILEGIVSNAKDVISGTRATMFMKNEEDNTLFTYLTTGEPVVHGTIFANVVMNEKKSRIFSSQEIIEMKLPPGKEDPNKPLEKTSFQLSKNSETTSSGVMKIVSSFTNQNQQSSSRTTQDSSQKANEYPETICCFPLLKDENDVVGVLELSCRRKIIPEDIKLLDCFSVFASVSLVKSELQTIAKLGRAEVELKKYITQTERTQVGIVPAKLKISGVDLFKIDFDAQQWEGIGFFRVIWAIFDSFRLLREFKIPNQTFFKFLDAISNTYNKVPYHNWRHAVDVSQFIAYEIKVSKLDLSFTKFELFGLFVAAICHDANHDGFTNVFNVKAETPLGILFKNQSVMETHHCTIAISVISKEECNIFESLDSTKLKEIWNIIITLILATDMARHHTILEEINQIIEKGPLNLKNPAHRFSAMKIILKCGDISNVSRPFVLADKWCDVLCEEFFRQGDLERTKGMEYTSPLNDRAHLDKPKSQIGFYTFVCLPLFQCAAKAIPALKVNVDQVESNLKVWKEATEKKNSE